MVDIARSPDVLRKKKIRRALYAAAALVVIVLITVGVSRLRPAAPSVDRATVWVDTVKRGPMLRQVRGSGTLVPEDIRWIPAHDAGPRRAHRPAPRRAGHAGHRDPRAEQPGARSSRCRRRSSLTSRRRPHFRTARRSSRARSSARQSQRRQHRDAVQAGGARPRSERDSSTRRGSISELSSSRSARPRPRS